MASKTFRRQRLLDVREIMLQLEAVELKNMEDAHLNERIALEAALIVKEEHVDTDLTNDSGETSGTLFDFRLQTYHTEKLNQDIRTRIDTSKETAEKVDQQRTVVEEQAKTKQSLEKLKEQDKERARLDSEREDQKAMDEVAARTYIASSHGRATG